MVGPVERCRRRSRTDRRHPRPSAYTLPSSDDLTQFTDPSFTMEVFGRITSRKMYSPCRSGFCHFAQDLLAILGAENLEEGNLIQPGVSLGARSFNGWRCWRFLLRLRQSNVPIPK